MIKISSAGVESGLASFTWSTSEQVYPFEKAPNGATLYCKKINLGNLPNSGYKDIAHGISGFNAGDDTFFFDAIMKLSATDSQTLPLTFVSDSQISYQIFCYISGANVGISTAINYSSYTAIARLIYKKSS